VGSARINPTGCFKTLLAGQGVKLQVHGIVVIPDHVHIIFTPLKEDEGNPFGLAEIMSGIEGASAHSVNKAFNRRGRVWQDESFDHVLRSDDYQWPGAETSVKMPLTEGRPARLSRPSPFILGLLQTVTFSDTPFDLLRPRDRGVRLKTASFHYFYAAVPKSEFGTFDALIEFSHSGNSIRVRKFLTKESKIPRLSQTGRRCYHKIEIC
jgi:hypothetical protein